MTRDELIVIARTIAARHNLPGELVCAVIEQESDWQVGALRHEPAFQTHYGPTYRKMFPECHYAESASFYSSWGLMQTMFAVLWECDIFRDAPDHLYEPEVGIEAGCRLLVGKLQRAGWKPDSGVPPTPEQTHRGLLLWNGGGRPAYADEVIARIPKYVDPCGSTSEAA